MMGKYAAWPTLIILALGSTCARSADRDDEQKQEPVKIGMVATLFRDMPEPLVIAMMHPFGALMESQTGIPGTLVQGGDACNLGKMLVQNQVQVAVFHGFEFAWAKQKYPQLTPLMIAVNQQEQLHVYIVARKDSKAKQLSDFHGKAIGFPKHSREHCRLYFERRCLCGTIDQQKLFRAVETPANTEDALDDVVDGVLPVAVIDGVGLECYKRRKPGRFSQLKIIQTSEAFPSATVAYVPGFLEEDTVIQFRRGLLNANKTAMGRQFMTLWKLTAFEPVPADYEKNLASIAKVYPMTSTAPEKKKPAGWLPMLLGTFDGK